MQDVALPVARVSPMQTAALVPSAALPPFTSAFPHRSNNTSGWSSTLLPGTGGGLLRFRFKGSCLLNDQQKFERAGPRASGDRTRTLNPLRQLRQLCLRHVLPNGRRALLRETRATSLQRNNTPRNPRCRPSQTVRWWKNSSHESFHITCSAVEVVERVSAGSNCATAFPDSLIAAARPQHPCKVEERFRIDRLRPPHGLGVQSALERRFRREVGGVTQEICQPLWRPCATVVRFASRRRQPYRHLRMLPDYADQPHFIRDFKRFTGQAAGVVLRDKASAFCWIPKGRRICTIRPLALHPITWRA